MSIGNVDIMIEQAYNQEKLVVLYYVRRRYPCPDGSHYFNNNIFLASEYSPASIL